MLFRSIDIANSYLKKISTNNYTENESLKFNDIAYQLLKKEPNSLEKKDKLDEVINMQCH